MAASIFTAITFSPVTEFIEKTRKLRDLYGSSFILSYLADAVCRQAEQTLGVEQEPVISPALLNIKMGTPDQIVIQGDFPEAIARKAFDDAWSNVMDACQQWVRTECEDWINEAYDRWVAKGQWHRKPSKTMPWDRDWQQWKNHAWEFFWVQAETIPEVLLALNQKEADRAWVGINWIGESSTLSGADAIAWPGLDRNIPAKQRRMAEADEEIRSFCKALNLKIGEAILEDDLKESRSDRQSRQAELIQRYGVDPQQRAATDLTEAEYIRQELARNLGEPILGDREQLSIPELTKRLSTLKAVASERMQQELPTSFRDVNTWTTDQPMGWFRGDGDQAGQHIRDITQNPATAPEKLKAFSTQMREWAQWLKQDFDERHGRIVFAGGDDFLGVFYPSDTPAHAIHWLCNFKEIVWHEGENQPPKRKPITPSVGFVWASPQVPQRDVLQHCEQAEQNAKHSGRDRVCLRVLFASGTHLEWCCPWWWLPQVVDNYRDRNGQKDWTHFYKDVAALKARHAFFGNHRIALTLFNLFFRDPDTGNSLLPHDSKTLFDADSSPLWTQPGTPEKLTGILHDDLKNADLAIQQEAFNDWVINLAQVGFYLFNTSDRS